MDYDDNSGEDNPDSILKSPTKDEAEDNDDGTDGERRRRRTLFAMRI